MKSKNPSNYIIVIVVVLCSLVLLGALTFALYGFQWRKGDRTFGIEFKDATGIKLHSSVRYAGAVAGTVSQIRYLTPAEREQSKDRKNIVRVTVELDQDAPPLPSDVTAGLASETILGEKFIALTSENPDAPPLPLDAVIQGRDIISLDALTRTAQSAIQNVNEILIKLNQDYPSLVPRLADALANANSLLEQGSAFVRNADTVITNANGVVVSFKTDYAELVRKLDGLLEQARSVAARAEAAIEQVTAFIARGDLLIKNNEANLGQMLSELRIVSQNLKVISTYTKALTGNLGQKPSRLIWGGQKIDLPKEEDILKSNQPFPVPLPVK